jgi:hypothetical protein
MDSNVQAATEPKMEDGNVDQPDSVSDAIFDVRDNWLRGFARIFPRPSRTRRPQIASVTLALILVALLIGAAAGGERAFARDFGLVTMNFDLWCQEEAHLPAKRCDRRTAADEKAFEAFQQELGPYEAQNLRKAQQEQWLDREFLDNDPIDNPSMRDPATAVQMPLPRRVDRQ